MSDRLCSQLRVALLRLPEVPPNEAYQLGQQCLSAGMDEGALLSFERAVVGGEVQAWLALSAVAMRLALPQRAFDASACALEAFPEAPEAHFNAALVAEMLGRYDVAAACYQSVLSLDGAFRGALINFPMALANLGRLQDAIEYSRAALQQFPTDPDLLFNDGNLQAARCAYDVALLQYRRACSISPTMHRAAIAAALMQAACGDILAAEAEFRRLRLDAPEEMAAFRSPLRADSGAQVLGMNLRRFSLIAGNEALRVADWRERDKHQSRYFEFVRDKVGAPDERELLFLSLAIDLPSELRLTLARRVATRVTREVSSLDLVRAQRRSGERIRVGYVSADFRRHPLFDLIMPLLDLHDRDRHEFILFSTAPDDGSEERKAIIERADCFIDLNGFDVPGMAQRIAQEAPDVLVDLSGYTLHAKSELFALRLAPVQVAYAGFLCTQGGDWFDCAVLDRRMLTLTERAAWCEPIAYTAHFPLPLPHRAQSSRFLPTQVAIAVERPQSESVVFAAFHAAWKINPRSFDAWMSILKRVPGSVLWLIGEDPATRRNLEAEAVLRGVDTARLCFGGHLSHVEHLARLRQSDLFLDAIGCNGHTTAAEALVSGLPVLTRPGVAVHERYASALLEAFLLQDLIADSDDNYVEIAVRFALDTNFRREISERVAERFSPDAVSAHNRACAASLEAVFAYCIEGKRESRGTTDFDVSLAQTNAR